MHTCVYMRIHVSIYIYIYIQNMLSGRREGGTELEKDMPACDFECVCACVHVCVQLNGIVLMTQPVWISYCHPLMGMLSYQLS